MSISPSRTLFVLGGSLTGLAIIRNAHAMKLQAVLFCTPGEIAAASRLAAVVTVDSCDRITLRKILDRNKCERECSLIATSDQWIHFIMEYRGDLEGEKFSILQAQNRSLNICLDKSLFNEWAMENRLQVPPFFSLPKRNSPEYLSTLTNLPYPLMVRPAISHHSNNPNRLPKAVSVENIVELEDTLHMYRKAEVRPLISQSLLPYPLIQYSVGVVRMHNRMRSFVAQKNRPTAELASVGTYVSLDPNDEVEALARRALEKLNYFGIAEVEILKRPDTGELFLVEINARPWLQYALAVRSGHDFLLFLVDVTKYASKKEQKTGFRWIDFNSDFFCAFSATVGLVRRGKLGLASYVISLFRSNSYARFAWNDALPFFKGLKELFSLISGSLR